MEKKNNNKQTNKQQRYFPSGSEEGDDGTMMNGTETSQRGGWWYGTGVQSNAPSRHHGKRQLYHVLPMLSDPCRVLPRPPPLPMLRDRAPASMLLCNSPCCPSTRRGRRSSHSAFNSLLLDPQRAALGGQAEVKLKKGTQEVIPANKTRVPARCSYKNLFHARIISINLLLTAVI